MEAYGMLLFMTELIQRHPDCVTVDPNRLIESGKCLVRFIQLMKQAGPNLNFDERQDLMNVWCRFEFLIETFEIDVPKNHLIYEIIWRSEWQGSPWTYTCFWDEHLNQTLKHCLRLCHQANFERRAFTRIAHVLSDKFCDL